MKHHCLCCSSVSEASSISVSNFTFYCPKCLANKKIKELSVYHVRAAAALLWRQVRSGEVYVPEHCECCFKVAKLAPLISNLAKVKASYWGCESCLNHWYSKWLWTTVLTDARDSVAQTLTNMGLQPKRAFTILETPHKITTAVLINRTLTKVI